MNPKTNMGEIIRKVLKEKNLTASWLARQICCNESNFCNKLKDNNLSKEILFRASVVLKTDLFRYYSEEARSKWDNG